MLILVTPASNELLIRVKAIALNPVDALYTASPLGRTGRIIGSDFAGFVHEVGSAVPHGSGLQVGTRVAGFVQGASSINNRPGAFAEYAVSPWDLVWKVANDMTLEQAATISLCALTAAQALFPRLGVDPPPGLDWNPSFSRVMPSSVFINAASTSVGLYAAQLIRLALPNAQLFGSASERHFETLKGAPYHYNGLVSYRTPEAWLAITPEGKGVDLAYDGISEADTVANLARVLSTKSPYACEFLQLGR